MSVFAALTVGLSTRQHCLSSTTSALLLVLFLSQVFRLSAATQPEGFALLIRSHTRDARSYFTVNVYVHSSLGHLRPRSRTRAPEDQLLDVPEDESSSTLHSRPDEESDCYLTYRLKQVLLFDPLQRTRNILKPPRPLHTTKLLSASRLFSLTPSSSSPPLLRKRVTLIFTSTSTSKLHTSFIIGSIQTRHSI